MEKWKHLDEQKQVYSAVITDGDIAVGQVLDVLKETGLEQNTIVIFASDNGPEWTGGRESKEVGTRLRRVLQHRPDRRTSRPQTQPIRRRCSRPVHRALARPRAGGRQKRQRPF